MSLKTFIIGSVFVACLLGAGYCLHIASTSQNPSPRETFLLSVVLFLLSSVSSIVIGYFFAKYSTTEKVDTFAERSAEKMINLSNELMRLSTYLEETEEVADQEFNHYAAQNAYRHRIEAAARMAQNIAITNVTLGNDWLAVASADTATAIDRKYAAFRSQIEDVQELERLQQTNATSQANVSIPIENRIAEIEQRMLARQDSIPKIPVRQVAQKAVIANQQIDEASDNRQSGYLTLSVVRDLFIATGSGTLQPHMTSVPSIHVELIKSPPEVDTKSLLIRPGTGTTYDFNITLKSTAFNVFVPKGDYRFRYEAVCSDGELDSVNNEASVSNSKEEAPN